jgi:hypothetical protein
MTAPPTTPGRPFLLGGLFFALAFAREANECGSFAPILFRLPLHRWVLWVLALDPVP